MRLGLISDIHGNRLALDAVLAELEHEGIEQLVCLGDVAVGPQPTESLDRIRELGCPVVMGNWDAAFLGRMPEPKNEISSMLVELAEWWAASLSPADREFMGNFVPTLDVNLGGLATFCFHGSPRSYDDWIFAADPGNDDLRQMLNGAEAPILVGGHTHVQMIRRLDGQVLFNPGSVGLPFREWWPKPVMISPCAEYGVLSNEDGRLSLDARRTSFDVDAFLDISRSSGMPHADWWVSCWARD